MESNIWWRMETQIWVMNTWCNIQIMYYSIVHFNVQCHSNKFSKKRMLVGPLWAAPSCVYIYLGSHYVWEGLKCSDTYLIQSPNIVAQKMNTGISHDPVYSLGSLMCLPFSLRGRLARAEQDGLLHMPVPWCQLTAGSLTAHCPSFWHVTAGLEQHSKKPGYTHVS